MNTIACDESLDSTTPIEEIRKGETDERTSSQTRSEASIGEDGETFAVVTSPLTHNENPEVDEETFNNHIEGNQALTFELHRGMAAQAEGNVVTSAWSLRQAFAMLYPGARGETKRAIGEVLSFEDDVEATLSATNLINDELTARQVDADDDRGLAPISLNSANSIWMQDGFKVFDDFLDLSRVHLDASVHLLDFFNQPEASRVLINDWVSHKTEDRINDLIPEGLIKPDTRLVLTNAVHFQAPWAKPFKEHRTSKQSFVTASGEEIETQTLDQVATFPISERDGVQALTMPFRQGQLAMTFLMPTEGSLAQLEDDLTPELWSELRAAQAPMKRRVFVPKFKFEFKVKLKEFLELQGLDILFKNPDLSGISDRPLVVGEVLQKAFIEVAEEGAEAAAATAILIESGSAPGPAPEPPLELRFDHAFLFLIHDVDTGAILFMGRLNDPR